MAELPNFYSLLELDPSVDDWEAIQARIQEKRRIWAKEKAMGNPRGRRTADRNLSLLPEMEAVLATPEGRSAQAGQAQRLGEEARRARFAEVDEAVAVFRSGGDRYTAAQLQLLARRFAGTLTEAELEERLRAHGLSPAPVEGERPAGEAKERISEEDASIARRNLEHLGLATLYAFLELAPQSSPAALRDRAATIYQENQRRGRTDADASARNELAGLCSKLFANAARKARYDNFLAVEAMDALRPNIDLAASDGFITQEELDALVRQGRQRGVGAEDARAYVEAYAARRRWGVQRAARLPAETLRLCGACGALGSAEANHCTRCGRPLSVECPRCGAATPTQDPACGRCGAHVGDAALVQALLREGERMAGEGRMAEARERFDHALRYWPGWAPAVAAREAAQARARAREAALAPVEALAAARRLCEGERELQRFVRAHGAGGTEALARSLRDGQDRARGAYDRGRAAAARGDGEGALEAFEAALALCADLQAARDALAAHPPPPPSALAVRPVAGGFHLAWRAAPSARPLAYRVVRGAGAAPAGPEDGAVVAETAGLAATDAAPEGAPVYYAVYALRGGVASAHAAQSGPHLSTAEVRGLVAVGGDGEVRLRWRRPSGCSRVEVWARPGAPPAPGEGALRVVAGDELHETGVRNDQGRGYRVVAVYADPATPGRELRTAGATATAIPVAPAPAVADLACTREGRTARLTWTPVPGGAVQLRQADQPPPFAPGQVIAADDAARCGRLVEPAGAGAANATLDGQGRTFFVPLTVAAGTATVGQPVEVTLLDSVGALAARRAGGGIALTWEWPAGVEEVVVAYAHDGYPAAPADGAATRATVSRAQYAAARGWELRGAERRRHYFSVFARAPDTELFAPPAHALASMGDEVAVRYRVRTRWLRGGAWVELQGTTRATLALPPLLLVARPGSVPLEPGDGRTLADLPGVRLEAGRAAIPLPPHCRGSGEYVRLFFRDPADTREIRLLPAEKERLRLS